MVSSEDPKISPGKGGGGKKWIAATVALLAVVIVLLAAYPINNLVSSATPSNSIASAQAIVATGQPFNITVSAPKEFKSVTVYFGDGSVETASYNGSNNASFSHIYSIPGSAYILYSIAYPGGGVYTSSDKLVQVTVSPDSTFLTPTESLASVAYNVSASSQALSNGQTLFAPGSYVDLGIGFYNEPQNSSYQVVSQKVLLSNGKEFQIPYSWNESSQAYVEGQSSINYTFPDSGLYVVTVYTFTAPVNNVTGNYSSSDVQMSTAFADYAVFKNAAIGSSGSASSFVRDRLETGGFSTLDGAIAYDGISLEILDNVYQTLVMYNGSNSSQFEPMLASTLPTVLNGGIYNSYSNYTRSYVNGTGQTVTYAVNITPYENFTFHIRSNATWQDGTPVTAWDVMYSLTRDLLFNSASPGTPGWILSQYILPGSLSGSTTFYNITQNMTVSNSTNSITFHFQQPMSPDLVFEVLGSYGTYIMSANWLIAHGAGITWTPAGFSAYKAEGSLPGYNSYVQTHVMSNGPYGISYTVPASEVVLTANPYFTSPGAWYPKPSIKTVQIRYVGDLSSLYLQLKSGEAQAGTIPTSNWNLATSLQNSGHFNITSFPSLSINFYNFNANVNTSDLKGIYRGANLPSDLFASHNARKAFAYAFNYQNFLNYQVGNAVYNSSLAMGYAGLLPQGMIGAQSIAELNKTTSGVPYYNPALAEQYWSQVNLGKFNIQNGSNGDLLYGGNTLVIPIFVSQSDPIDLAGAETFASTLSTFIKGATFPIVQISVPQSIAYVSPGQNPMPLYMLSGTWGPDYPYPTDYLGPIGIPWSNAYYAGSDGFTASYFNSVGEAQQAATMSSMVSDYNSASLIANTTQAIVQFHKLNEMVVNMTFFIYTYQTNGFWITSSNVNQHDISAYQENVMRGGDGAMLYNLLSYN